MIHHIHADDQVALRFVHTLSLPLCTVVIFHDIMETMTRVQIPLFKWDYMLLRICYSAPAFCSLSLSEARPWFIGLDIRDFKSRKLAQNYPELKDRKIAWIKSCGHNPPFNSQSLWQYLFLPRRTLNAVLTNCLLWDACSSFSSAHYHSSRQAVRYFVESLWTCAVKMNCPWQARSSLWMTGCDILLMKMV
jgi:hypothetical protein